jgi:hypothetical protein
MTYMGERRTIYMIFVGNLQGEKPLVRPMLRWEFNIKMDLQKVGWEHGLDYLAQDKDKCQALVNTVMKLQAPKSREFLDWLRNC